MNKYKPLVTLLLILIGFCAYAQEYPVNVTTVLTPPYSLYLSDYTSPETNSLQVIIQLRELDRPEYRVKLRITIEGQGITIRTKPSYNPPALILQGGVPEMLSGADLSRYLSPDNLDFSGISRQEFLKKGTFPEGFYTFKVEVIDYIRNVVVSNPGFANAWIILNDPPLINLPFNDDKVIATDPQNIFFNWTPRHTASPNAAFSTEYEFTLVELYPVGRIPNDAIRVANPIFVTTTQSTSLNYGVMEPMLIPGRKYAFRVKAFDTGKRDLFKNNGFSEVFVFQYGDACVAPLNIKSEALDATRIKLTWEPTETHTGFTVKYKKQGGTTWYEEKTFSNSIILPELQGSTTYEYQVSGNCGTIQGLYSSVATITTPEKVKEEFACGAPPPQLDIKTTPLLNDLQIKDRIKTSDFEVSISTVERNSDGTYKGTGRALLPWLKFASVEVKFHNIRVNEEYRVYDGNVTTIYSVNSSFVANIDLADDKLKGENADGTNNPNAPGADDFKGIDTTYAGDIKNITVDIATGNILIANEDGTTTVMPREKDEKTNTYDDVRVTDSNGDKWRIDSNGTVTQEPSTTPPNAIASADAIDFTVQFAPNTDQNYGFDQKAQNSIGTYNNIKVKGADYWISWKSVETGRQDFVSVQASGKETFPAIVGFKTSIGEAPSQPGSTINQKQLIVFGQGNADESISAYVLVKEPGKEQTEIEVGRLNVRAYDKVRKHLIIVPVNEVAAPDGTALTAAINSIYKSAVAEWDITVEAKFTIDNAKLTGLDAGESGLLASFPEKSRDFNRAFKNDRNIDNDAYYIFLIKGSGSSRSGFMPFKRKFGYIFTDNLGNLSLETTIAHEIGHGAFRLRHTFSTEAFMAAESSTDNLMDYKGGTALRKHQWDFVHDPESMNGWMQDDEESAAAGATFSTTEKRKEMPLGIFMGLTPNGKIVDDVMALASNEYAIPTIGPSMPYVIMGFDIYVDKEKTKSYRWSSSTLGYTGTGGTAGELFVSLSQAKSYVNIYQLSGNNCTYKLQIIEWDPTIAVTDITAEIKEKVVEGRWAIRTLFSPDPSCLTTFVQEILQRDDDHTICNNERIEEEKAELLAIVNAATIDEMKLTYKINSVCKSSIKSLTYTQLEKLFIKLASAEEIQEVKEVAILRLASSINTTDYSSFYTLLEKDKNALLRNLVAKMHDKSIYPWDGNNYTNFIGGLCWIFQHYTGVEKIIQNEEPNLLGKIVSLKPYKFKETSWASPYTGNMRFNSRYSDETGLVTVFQEEGKMVSGPGGTGGEGFDQLGDDFPAVSPLSPIIVVMTPDELPLVNTALQSAAALSPNQYVVPAIFLKYRHDKITADATEKGIMITLDVVTIYASGGIALAAKVGWARRLWALTEVAGALGNIGVNTGVIKQGDKLYTAVEAYNIAMLIIGVKHIAGATPGAIKGIYNFAKVLPAETKELLRLNSNLRTLMVAQYIKWRGAITNMDNLSAAEKQLVNEGRISEVRSIEANKLAELEGQQSVWKALGVTDEAAEAGSVWARFTRVSGLNQAALARIENWAETLVQRLDDALGNYSGLANEINANANLMDEFRTYSTWEGRYASKMNFLDGRIANAQEFERMLDASIPPLQNGRQPQNIQDLGRVFDQDYVTEAQRAFDQADFTNLPHLQPYHAQGYQIVTGQVRIRSGVTIGTAVEVRPDVMLFQVNASTGQVTRASAVWNECKIRPTSPPTANQRTIFDFLTNGTINRNQMEFEVLTNKQALVDMGLSRGTTIGIEGINQISVTQNGVLSVTRIY